MGQDNFSCASKKFFLRISKNIIINYLNLVQEVASVTDFALNV